MAEKKNMYHNSKIYTIRSHQSEKYYIGSTTQPLYKRLHRHRLNKKNYDNGIFHNITSFEILQYDDHYIELLEEYRCDNKQQLEKREGELIREHKNNLVNKCIAGRTRKQRYEDNKEDVLKWHKQYREDNKEILSEDKKQYYKDNKEIIKEKRKEKITCICGSNIRKYEKLRHNNTKRHQTFISLNN
jgi:hypothetical protein